MNHDQHSLAIKYLIERLPPEDQDELKTLLGTEDEPDLAEDGLKGRVALDRLPARIKRQALARATAGGAAKNEKHFAEMFPDATRIKHI